jgi:hypothetical protein
MTATLLSLFPVAICLALMFGAGAAISLAARTPLRRLPLLARRAKSGTSEPGTGTAA